ncbi:hypothetical protein TI04_13355 [Achromatium sp. WMS2]|nr:hypothetical protein TI04_13355 [Achromatium sp. WMS2]
MDSQEIIEIKIEFIKDIDDTEIETEIKTNTGIISSNIYHNDGNYTDWYEQEEHGTNISNNDNEYEEE